MSLIRTSSAPILAAAVLLSGVQQAQAEQAALLTVTVEASRTSQLGLADSANQGSITGRELELRTVYRPAEILEAAPGLIVGQHSGEGKASQYYLRGFNLDHGTDLATFVDDMPVNQRSHAHGQGWTDLNFLIPEVVARLDYSKGPYSARLGDFASAGGVTVNYANRLADNVATLSGGQNAYGRAALAASAELAGGSLLYALEEVHNNGPYTRGDNYRKVNGVLRYSAGPASNGWSVTAMSYRGRWNSTDQIPLRAVQDGSIGRFDAVDNTDGGAAARSSLSATWRSTTAESASKLNAYVIRNRLELFSDFTYYMDDPLNGDQFGQPDRRVTSGFAASHTWRALPLLGQMGDWTLGLTGQNDNVFNGLNHTRAQQVLSTTRQDHIVESSAALYLENATRWNDSLRSVAGVRADRYRFNVKSNLADNSGIAGAQLLSPSLSLIASPLAQTELYLNLGKGFHSNDARGTVARVDVKTGETLTPVPGLVQSKGQEVGLRTELIPRMQSSLSLYRLDFDSELTYIGDSGTTEAGRPSRRYGVEISNYYKVLPWLSFDVDAAYAHARSRDHDALAGDYIEDAVEGVGQLALTVDKYGPWSGALRLRYFGPRPLTPDNRVRSRSSFTLNGHVAYQLTPRLRLSLEAFNIANRKVSAIDYFYSSQLRGEAAPVEDVHFHPSESRSLRATLIANW